MATNGWTPYHEKPAGPVPVVNRFENYNRNHHNAEIAVSFENFSHRCVDGGESMLAVSTA